MNARRHAHMANRYQTDGMATASPRKLLVLLFERLVRDLDQGREALVAGHIETAHNALVHAQEIVHELRLALDPEVWESASQMLSIYDYVYDLLIEANQQKSLAPLEEAYALILPIGEAWNEAYAEVQMGQTVSFGAPV